MANIITSSRILCSIVLLFLPTFSPGFYGAYLIGGLSDMIDGTVARKTNSVSDLGSKLDTAADFIFLAASSIKLLPAIDIPTWLYIWIGLIAAIKIINLVSAFISGRSFLAVHTVMNKFTGLLLFMLPLTLQLIEIKYSAIFVCAVATLAAVEEGCFIRR